MDREFILSMKTWSISDDSGWHPNWKLARSQSIHHDQKTEGLQAEATWCPFTGLEVDAYFFGECVAIHDFSKMNMPERNFSGQNLVAADFSQASLDFANFSFVSACLSNFANSKLMASRFVSAHLVFADFSAADLQNADLSHADLCCANFQVATLKDARLNEACLERANFGEADLRGADLRGVDARGVHWKNGIFNEQTKLPFGFEEALAFGMIFHPESYHGVSESNFRGARENSYESN